MKSHNSKTGRKLELRRKILRDVPHPVVLELFAGPGRMRDSVYAGMDVVGFDQDLGSVAEYAGDAAYLARCIDLSRFTVFDADAFANPWEVLWIVGQRREARGTIAVFGTDGGMGGGSNMHPSFRRKGWSRQMCDAIGVSPSDSPRGIATGKEAVGRLGHRFLEAFFCDWSVVRYLTSNGGGSGGTLYFGAVLTAGRPAE